MALPNKLKDFNMFGDGNIWQGKIAELNLPKLARKMIEFSGAGMDGTVELDMGNEKIEFEWSAGGMIKEIFDGFGATKLDNNMIRFMGAYERDDTEEVIAVEVIVRGRHREIDMGTAKKGDDNMIKVVTSCSYYKLLVDGAAVIEIDVPGYVFLVNGEDRLASKRGAIGM